MKTLIALAVLFNMTAVSAQVQHPSVYSPIWKIKKVSPMCPNDIPAGAVCFGLGSIVTVETTIGCADTLLSKEFDVWENNEIHVNSIAKRHPKADVIRCVRAQTIQDTVLVPMPGQVTIVNDTLEFAN